MEAFAIIILLFIFVTLIMTWVNTSRLNSANTEIVYLKDKLRNLQRSFDNFTRVKEKTTSQGDISEKQQVVVKEVVEEIKGPVALKETLEKEIPVFKISAQKKIIPREPIVKVKNWESDTKQKDAKKNNSFERQFGEKLPVWIGGIALALAGIFLVKYSIDKGYLTEQVRIILGFIFGFGLLYSGHAVHKKPDMANGIRISQSLFGAGIVTLYSVTYAATNMYEFFPSWLGFFGMAAITASAVVLSLRHGKPIAIMGMVGGFLAPVFVSPDDPTAFMMFGYFYLLFTGLMTLIRSQKWWGLAIPALIFSFIWMSYWLLMGYMQGDSLVLGIFLMGLVGTLLITSRGLFDDVKWSHSVSFLNRSAITGVLIFMAIIVGKGDYGLLEWGLYPMLASMVH